jgi:hypothetical protein
MDSRFAIRPFLLTTAGAILFGGFSLFSPADASRPLSKLLGISAPTSAEVRAVGAWYDRHIPPRFRARQSVSVSLLANSEMNVYLESNAGTSAEDGDGDIDGVFENDPPNITLRLSTDGILDEQIFAHEYGHYVWFDLLRDSDRRHYQKIYDRQKAAHALITDYAQTSVQEGFAEAFSYYVNHPARLARRDALSYRFLAHWHCVSSQN